MLVWDTGPLLAALDRGDVRHEACRDLLQASREDFVIPGLVLAEVDYWLHKRAIPVAWIGFLEDINSGAWIVDWPTALDLERAVELQRIYAGVGVVDATVLALVERHDETKLVTLDRRHFGAMKPLHGEAPALLPA